MMMSAEPILRLLSVWDFAALALLVTALFASTRIIEHPPAARPSVHVLMRAHRRAWMAQMAARDVRIFDAQVVATLRQGATFFASTCLIAIGGGAALLGQAERLVDVASDLGAGTDAPLVVWEVKILVVLVLLTLAFLKFVWSIRLFGYCAVVMSAVPNDPDHPEAQAARAAELNILADRSFTRGLRSVYFALAALAWLIGPGAFAAAVLITTAIIARREFASQTRDLLTS